MKKTAVEWFAERIQSDKIFSFEKVLEKAKEMEKQEHKETWEEGIDTGKDTERGFPPTWIDFEQYYNETYGK